MEDEKIDMTWKEKKSCNGCGVCCNTDAFLIKEKGLAEWFSLRGFKRPIGQEEITHVLIRKVDEDTVKIVFFSHCERAITQTLASGKQVTRCNNYENRPDRCKQFPWTPESCACIPECSYNLPNPIEEDKNIEHQLFPQEKESTND